MITWRITVDLARESSQFGAGPSQISSFGRSTMRKPLVRTIVAVAAAVAATALGSGVASATVITPGTWTVSPSGPIAATAGTTTLVGPSATLTCSSSTVSGTAVATATGSPATLASLPAP